MKQRARRATLWVMVAGFILVLGPTIVYRDAMRDHFEAWHLQLTTETRTIEPAGLIPSQHHREALLSHVAKSFRRPVIFAPKDIGPPVKWPTRMRVSRLLEINGWRVLEQRFPRRAYVVIPDEVR